MNLATVIKGSIPQNKNEIALDRLFAENNGLDISGIINIAGEEMKIVGLISLPDYSSLFEKSTNLMLDSFHFGVSVVDMETFRDFKEDGLVYNYSYRMNNRDLGKNEKTSLSDEMRKVFTENAVPLTNFLTADENPCISFVEDDMGSDVPMMKVFLSIIMVIMAFVFVIVISNTIESESAIIGTLLASGCKKWELIGHYMTLPVFVILVSALIGNILSYTIMPQVFMRLYYSSYSLPPMEVKLNAEAILLTTVLPIILMLIVNLFALTRKLRLSPLKFLRKDIKRNKNKKAKRLPNFSFVNRFRVRLILQNKGSYIILFFGIVFASFLLMFGLSLTTTISHYVERIKETAVADYQYILKYPVEANGNEENREKFMLHTLETYYPPANKDYEVSFYGLQENSSYFPNMEFSSNENQNKVILSDSLAKKIGARVGDIITFTDSYTNDDYSLTVTGIYDYPSALSAFMEIGQLNRMLGKDTLYFNGYFSDKMLELDERSLATIITPEDMSGLSDQMLSTFGQMAPICLFASIVIYLVLMYILTKIVIDKNAINISFMKVFGYQEREIRKLYLNATSITVIASLFLAMPPVCYGISVAYRLAFIKINGYMEAYMPFYPFLRSLFVFQGLLFVWNWILGNILLFFCFLVFHLSSLNNDEVVP